MAISSSIISSLISVFVKYCSQLINCINKTVSYLHEVFKYKTEKETKAIKEDFNKRIEAIIDNGDIEDILDIRR